MSTLKFRLPWLFMAHLYFFFLPALHVEFQDQNFYPFCWFVRFFLSKSSGIIVEVNMKFKWKQNWWNLLSILKHTRCVLLLNGTFINVFCQSAILFGKVQEIFEISFFWQSTIENVLKNLWCYIKRSVTIERAGVKLISNRLSKNWRPIISLRAVLASKIGLDLVYKKLGNE